MRAFTNERRIRRGRFFSTSFSISGMLMMLSSWVGIAFLSQTVGYSTFPLLFPGMIFTVIGIHLTRKWIRQPHAHISLTNALKGISKDAVLLNYYSPSSHILLTTDGVFTLTTRKQQFNLLITNSDWIDRAPLSERIKRTIAQDTIGNPIRDAHHDANRASKWLKQILDREVTVQPLLVFLHPKTFLEVVEQTSVPVTYADKKTPSLKSFLKTQSNALTKEEIETIISSIQLHDERHT